ncbi:MAG: zinc-binding dehydrogenase [Deltaproteobacteria bacterium]|nr:zinc-binding dehydrogenase [Deltaproteobacteria bacterium]
MSGVAHCIDYRSQDFHEEVMRITGGDGVDIVLDALGGEALARSYRCLAPLGRVYAFGASSFAPGKRRSLLAALEGVWKMPTFRPLALMDKNRGVHGVNLGHLWERTEQLNAMLGEILGLVADGTFEPVVDRSFPFDQAADAHTYIQDRKNFGKVLLVP